MKRLYPGRRTLLSLLAISSLFPALAGNVPQYSVSAGDASARYAEFSDGTPIPCRWTTGNYALLPDGGTSPNVTTAQGFPIGFDFRFAGTVVNRFIPSNTGNIYLGRDNVTYGNGCFCVCLSPIMHGLKGGQISYRVTGSEGDRVLVLQWKNATIDTSQGYVGRYSMQIRLYESDGRIEMALKELETPSTSNGFATSIHGWDGRDALLLTAEGLAKPFSVSPNYKADMLTPSSFIRWDADDYDQGYSPVFIFTPESDTKAPASAPVDLKVVQDGGDLLISCTRGADADATAVLVSTEPFTAADMPVDGETFRASYTDSNGKQWFPTRIGNAIPLTYLNDGAISTVLKGVETGKTYYIRAISANGYPAWNRTDFAEAVFTTSQPAPSAFSASAANAGSILLNVNAADPVIIAATTEREPGYGKGYNGLFGTPSPDAAVGDAIEGGGRVIYVGQPGEFRCEAELNAMTYFRAWTVRDGRLSSTTADCAAAPAVSFPFAPAVEDYPQGEAILGWEAVPSGSVSYLPVSRGEQGAENAVKAVSINGERMVLRSPAMPLDRPLKVSFEWAMETVRPPESSEDSGSIELPKGNKPGEFGSGSLDLVLNGMVHRSVNRYEGSMRIFAGDEYVEGSSTFVPFVAEIPQSSGEGRLEISFAGDAANTSILYLRAIRVEYAESIPEAPKSAPTALAVDEDRDGFLHVSCVRGADAAYTAVLVSTEPVTASDLPADGVSPEVGAKSGKATVIYWGKDENVVCATTLETLLVDFDTPYHVAAVSASTAPLYRRDDITQVVYRTLPDFGAPSALAAEYKPAEKTLDITATRAANATGTLILVSTGEFDGVPEDGREYTAGETLGNAAVVYSGTDAEIALRHVLSNVPESVTVTAFSRNPKGWYSTQARTATVSTLESSVGSIAADSDLSRAEVYTLTGVRLNVSTLSDLPAGVYLVNNRKVIIR